MKPSTQLIALGREPGKYYGAVNPPIIRASTIVFPSYADYEAAEAGRYHQSSYGIYGTPNQHYLAETLAAIEGADKAIITQSGLSAVTLTLLSFLSAGDHVLITDSVYGPTRRFCLHEMKRFGVETSFYDPLIGEGIAGHIKPNTKLVFVESPGSLTFEIQDIPAISKAVKAVNPDIIIVSDTTWATPLYFRPFEKGVDVSIHAATKYINGHADVLMGTVSCREAHYKKLLDTNKFLGLCSNPEDCYLALRGLRSMEARLARHQDSALKIAQWLESRDDVVEVFYPALPGSRGHELWKRDFTGSASLFGFRMKRTYSRDAIASFCDQLAYFGMGYSWGGFESLILHIDPSPVRSATQWPFTETYFRIHIGLEAPEDLMEDLEAGFKRLNA
jgi:cystathionine beta-lyase